MAYFTVPKTATLKVQPFSFKVSDEDLQQFQLLVKHSRLAPQTYENSQPETITFGVTHEWMKKTKHYWETQYDWRAREAYINSFPNFKTSIKDDQSNFVFDIHFAALFSQKPDAVPLTFLHGWPGSFLEFLGVLDYFRSKYQPAELPFHIVVPSLPGYTLSSGPPTDRDFKVQDIANVIDKLMTGLGFEGYVAQGGDIGSYTCRALSKYPACKAVHLNFSLMDKPDSVSEDQVNSVERQGLQQAEDFGLIHSAYALEHGTKPATIGFVLESSPIAILAWIGEKFITWTDETPSTEAILDSISLYWFTNSFSRCIFPYRQFHGSMAGAYYIHKDPEYRIDKPLGYSYFPKELAPMPRSWVATTGNLVWTQQHEKGGHFAAMEQPQLMAEDMESFIKQVW